MPGNVLVIAEHWKGQAEGVTFQMLTKGRALADAMGCGLDVLVLGHEVGGVAAALVDQGADAIYTVDDPALATAACGLAAEAAVAALRQLSPRLTLLGYTLVGMELGPAIAVRLDVTAMTNCVSVDYVDGSVTVARPVYDGSLHATLVLDAGAPALVALQKGATPTLPLDSRNARIEKLAIDVGSLPKRGEVLEFIEEPVSDVDITKADIIVSAGRGLGDPAKLGLIDECAKALGGMMGCSRPLVDQGWLPRERQVGASGKTVTPKVYIACGISGASQHLAGMSESRMIIAINKDANAPIFQVAHFGVVGDLFEFVPELTAQARKG
jgi:electron transfer flavoprotein alpha subunit